MLKAAYFITTLIATAPTLYAGPGFYGFNRDSTGGRSFGGVADINSQGMVALSGSTSAIWSPETGYVHEFITGEILRVSKSGNSALVISAGDSDLWTPMGSTQLPKRMWAMNYDGTIFAGQSSQTSLAHTWDAQNGERSLGTLPTDLFGDSGINDMSSDGRTMVGFAWNGERNSAVKFDADGQISELGNLDGYEQSAAWGVSNNGRYITGISQTGQNFGAFRWDKEEGELQDLGGRWSDDGIHRRGYAVSEDGTVAGNMIIEDMGRGDSVSIATIFTDTSGWRSVREVLLEDHGIEIDPNWHLQNARSISADGTIIGGDGYFRNAQGQRQNSAWVVVVPTPGSLILLSAGLLPISRRRR